MKKICFSLIVFILTNTVWAQDTTVVSNDTKDETVSIAIVEDIPVFPGCEEIEKKESINCFQNKLSEHIAKNFKYPPKATLQKIEGKVIVQFTINYEGKVTNIKTRIGDPILQTEALRIIKLLPLMKPALYKGKPIGVNYVVPINFKLK